MLAPREARFIAVALVTAGSDVITPLAVDDYGRSLTLPFGAARLAGPSERQAAAVPIPLEITLPNPLKPKTNVVAVFSERELTKPQIHRYVTGLARHSRVAVVSTPLTTK